MSYKCCEPRVVSLDEYGIKNVKEIFHNLSYEDLFIHETNPALKGLDKGF